MIGKAEVYIGTSMEMASAIRDVLDQNGVKNWVRTDETNSRMPVSSQTPMGFGVSREKTTYKIWVNKADKDQAQYLIRQIGR